MASSTNASTDDGIVEEATEDLLLPRRPVRRILVPTNFSPLSLEPLGLAAELARATGAELHILWVDKLGAARPTVEFPTEEDVRSAWWSAAPERLHELSGGSHVEPELHCVVERGVEVAPSIARYAYEKDVDLIVMATAARSGVAHFFLGSVAEQVVRIAPCSVLVAGHDALARPVSERPRILSAIDFSEISLESSRLAGELAGSLGADLRVVHAVSVQPAPAFYGMESALTPDIFDGMVRRSKEELAKFVATEFEDAQWKVLVGPAVHSILEAAKEGEVDLIVVGSHGLTGLPRLLLGSVTEKLLRHAEVPVLVVRPAAHGPEEDAS